MADNNYVLALKLARRHLKSRGNYYICLALDLVKHQNKHLADECESLQNTIEQRLGKTSMHEDIISLGNWISEHHKHLFTDDWRYNTKKLLEARLAWIDSLIEEFRDKQPEVPRKRVTRPAALRHNTP